MNTKRQEKTEETEIRNIDKLKAKKEELAAAIRKTRPEHKEAQRGNGTQPSWSLGAKLKRLQYEYRHHHIAHCELRGRTRKEIENKNRDDNHPNEAYIQCLKDQYAWTPEEITAYTERRARHEKAICANS